jgi:hypothetical protein
MSAGGATGSMGASLRDVSTFETIGGEGVGSGSGGGAIGGAGAGGDAARVSADGVAAGASIGGAEEAGAAGRGSGSKAAVSSAGAAVCAPGGAGSAGGRDAPVSVGLSGAPFSSASLIATRPSKSRKFHAACLPGTYTMPHCGEFRNAALQSARKTQRGL